MQIPRYTKTVLALAISAAFSACALQTERSSSGPGATGRTAAPPPPAYEPAQYATPSEYEPAQYAEVPAVTEAEPEEVEEFAEEEEEIVEEFAEEESVAVAEEPTARADAEMPEFAEEEQIDEDVAEDEGPLLAAEEATTAEPESEHEAMPEFAEEEEEELELVAEDEEPFAVAEAAEPETLAAAPPVMPEFAEEEEEATEEVAEEHEPLTAPQEETAVAYEEEPGVAGDDGIVSQSQFYDEEGVDQEEGIIAQSQYYEEEAGAKPAETIGEPQQTDEMMAQEAAQDPTPVVLPVTITLEAEPWFDFDRSAVRSDGRSKLDELVNGLQQVEYDTILVVGHADRIGTEGYNEALSMRRANAVKSYLAGKGVPLNRIRIEGRGEFEPSTDANTCGNLRRRKLIECLQPDRRVEVTVTGQRMAQK